MSVKAGQAQEHARRAYELTYLICDHTSKFGRSALQAYGASLRNRSVTFSLPTSCTKVDAGYWSRSPAYEGPLRSVQGDAAAALFCCKDLQPSRALTLKRRVPLADWRSSVP